MKIWRAPPKKAYRPRNPTITSRMMAAVRGMNNTAEVALRRRLWARGFRYRLYSRAVPGRPDILFPGRRVAIFVDGDFWHGRAIQEQGIPAFRATMRTKRRDWWVKKIVSNIDRDRRVTTALEEEGWHVIRLWESAIKSDPDKAAREIERHLKRVKARKTDAGTTK